MGYSGGERLVGRQVRQRLHRCGHPRDDGASCSPVGIAQLQALFSINLHPFNPFMSSLQRITTEYSEVEDRIRLVGEAAHQTVVLWCTQRLMNRLVPHLCKWLEERVGRTPSCEVRQAFAQHRARSELMPQVPVRGDAKHLAVLVHSVDLRASKAGVSLLFKDATGDTVASLPFEPRALRQWLNILGDQYHRGQWPLTVWPNWVVEPKVPPAADHAAVLH